MRTEELRTVKHFDNRSPGSAAHLHSDEPIQGKNKDKQGLKSFLLKACPGYLYSSPHTLFKYRYVLRLQPGFSETRKHLTWLSSLFSAQSQRWLSAPARSGAQQRGAARSSALSIIITCWLQDVHSSFGKAHCGQCHPFSYMLVFKE